MTPWLRSASWGPRRTERPRRVVRVELEPLDLIPLALMAAALVALAATL